MRLIYHDESKPLSYEEVYKDCQRGYGIKEPDKVSGFMGFFYRLPDIYVYGKLEQWMANNDKIEPELQKFIECFYHEDYGFVTRSESDLNLENRWLCGSTIWAIARYNFTDENLSHHYGGIVLEFFREYGLFYSIEEDMREIYAKEHNNPYYKQELEYHSG